MIRWISKDEKVSVDSNADGSLTVKAPGDFKLEREDREELARFLNFSGVPQYMGHPPGGMIQ